jgi:ABC-type nickel/cobalt efflux system permease component RcnA
VLASALGLGAAHALEVDHMAAVSAFVARRPTLRESVVFGIKWSLGHGLSLILLGSFLYLLKLKILEPVAGGLERLVGVALVGLGIWTLLQLRPGQIHHSHSHPAAEHEHSHDESTHSAGSHGEHTHEDGTTHSHGHSHGSLWMGLLHGAAGTAAFAGETLVAVAHSYWMVLAYTLAFSVGVMVAMAVYAGALGGLISFGGRRLRGVAYGAQVLTGALACTVGVCWIFGIELPALLPH